MSEVVEFPAPKIEFPEPKVDKFRQEQWAFYCLLGDLLKTHRRQYVAVHNKQVVESSPDKMDVIRRAYQRFGNVPIYVGLVSDAPPPVVRMPRYNFLRRAGELG